MKKILFASFAVLSLVLVGCKHHEEFSFSGKVVGYEICHSMNDFAYLVSLESPSDIGDSILIVEDSTRRGHVIAVYQSPRILKIGRHISGTIYLDDNYNQAHCYTHYTYMDLVTGKDISLRQAIFVKVHMDD